MFVIPKPPWTLLGKTLESKLRKALFSFQLLDGATKLAVALSGGKDSLALLFLLHATLGRGIRPLKLVALHVDGAYSCGAGVSLAFLQRICEEMGIDFYHRSSLTKQEKLACYSCSRERRKLLFAMAKETFCSHIAFGHHKDDAVQTLLLNMLHKGEVASMLPKVPMEKYGITIIRPLFYIGEEEITRFSEKQGFRRITCKCPVGQTSKRKSASQVIKQMEEHFPRARQNLFLAGENYGSKKALKSAPKTK